MTTDSFRGPRWAIPPPMTGENDQERMDDGSADDEAADGTYVEDDCRVCGKTLLFDTGGKGEIGYVDECEPCLAESAREARKTHTERSPETPGDLPTMPDGGRVDDDETFGTLVYQDE